MKNSTTILESFTKMSFGSSILFLCCCGNKSTPQIMEPSLAIDSIVFYYTYEEFISFSDYTAKEFAQNVKNYRKEYGHIKITDRDTIRMLYQKVKALKPAIDSLQPDVDTRIMGIFHNPAKNDSIYFSALREHAIQLNHLTMQSDS